MNETTGHTGVISKSKIQRLYKISVSTLQRLLNVKYYEVLHAEGYSKTSKNLSPKQFEIFVSLYGEA